ncbi:MAG TPA: hypothetical protein VF801_06075 [Rhodocyclaceae bacterium]
MIELRPALLALLFASAPAAAQSLPLMECGRVQSNTHIRCTADGEPAFVRDHRAYWSDVPSKVTLAQRYIEESECHASLEARCEQVSTLPSSYSTVWVFDQALGSKGCEEGATGNGWIDPYLAWRARMILPRRSLAQTWLLTIVTTTLTANTIRSYPNAAAGIAPCHLLITGIDTSKDIAIARAGAPAEQRAILSGFSPGEYLAELQCPAIQGSDCRPGKATLSLQITASPEER